MGSELDGIGRLATVVDALYEADRTKARALQDEVDAHLATLARLDDQARGLFAIGAASIDRHRLGIDTLWHERLMHERERTLYALSSLRAQQEEVRQRLTESFGRREAVRDLARKAETRARKDRSARSDANLHALVIQRAARQKNGGGRPAAPPSTTVKVDQFDGPTDAR